MRLIVTAMKNEGPFILEWAAYHLSIGFDRFLVYTNDCDDGTDAIWASRLKIDSRTRSDVGRRCALPPPFAPGADSAVPLNRPPTILMRLLLPSGQSTCSSAEIA